MIYDLAVVGGGLAGWSLIRALRQAGWPAERLLLLEGRVSGAGTSGIPWALMHPFPGRSLFPRPDYLRAWTRSLAWLEQLQAETGSPLFRRLPLWRLPLDAATAGRFARSFDRARDLPGYPLRRFAGPELAAWPAAGCGYALAEARLVALPLLLRQLIRQPIGLQQDCPVTRLHPAGAEWRLQAGPHSYRARQVVLACGSGLSRLLPQVQLDVSHGEIALFRLPEALPPVALSAAGQFVAPLGEGLCHGGATHYGGLRPAAAETVWPRLQASLAWLPGVAAARPVRLWHGLRAGVLPDREPLVGPVPGQTGLWLMAAFSTRGTLLIPQAADWLTAELAGQHALPDWIRPERLKVW